WSTNNRPSADRGLQVTRQRPGTERPSVEEDGRVRRPCPNQRNKSERKENMRQPQLCSMPVRPRGLRPPCRTVQSGNAVSPLAFAQLALGLRLADPGNGGSKAVVSWAEGTNLLAVWRTCSELSERAISASRRLTATVCEDWAARACTARILTDSSVSCESWSSQTTGSMSVRFLIRLITEDRCAGLGLTSRPPRLISSWFRPRALSTAVAVSRMVESES